MATFECPDCGNQVSPMAPNCPKCGRPIAPQAPPQRPQQPQTVIIQQPAPEKKKKTSCLSIGIAGFILLVVIIAIANRNTDPGPPQAAPVAKPAAKAPEAPALEVSAAQLYADYQANEVAADAKYKNKKLLVTGNVKEISKDAFGSPNLLLRTSNQFSSIMAGFSRANEGQLVSLAKGQKVTIRCLGGTMIIGSPSLKDCSVESE